MHQSLDAIFLCFRMKKNPMVDSDTEKYHPYKSFWNVAKCNLFRNPLIFSIIAQSYKCLFVYNL